MKEHSGWEVSILEPMDKDSQLRTLDDLFSRLQRFMQFQTVFKKYGLTATQAFILNYLDKHGQTKASDLAKVAGLSPGAVTQVCDELVRENHVDRTRSNTDRRVVYIEITEAGQQLLERIIRDRSLQFGQVLEQLSSDDAAEFIRIIRKVVLILEGQSNQSTVNSSLL